ncbi:hypothetical protein FPSE_07356 [Fusarium pseudograminearum CS3096]|uniref:Uncharacterized protein n=1 Tax=Fusarium pseudograminearum (strain CS3096) TaxID=1028729 RepID=K3VZI8_FUSPC|nr:hypothetical protein FPSE_07356 [Fusarium pseudograminearum CS3096]EKJ72475.1 hypothetical protein FPSE_07356 [Fusarium pseudograminearum CS3096]
MAEQARLQGSKENFQAAYDAAVSQKEDQEKHWKEEKEMAPEDKVSKLTPLTIDHAPGFSAALNQYRGARAAYMDALSAVDEQAAKTWQEKIKQASRRPNGSIDTNALIAPDA